MRSRFEDSVLSLFLHLSLILSLLHNPEVSIAAACPYLTWTCHTPCNLQFPVCKQAWCGSRWRLSRQYKLQYIEYILKWTFPLRLLCIVVHVVFYVNKLKRVVAKCLPPRVVGIGPSALMSPEAYETFPHKPSRDVGMVATVYPENKHTLYISW